MAKQRTHLVTGVILAGGALAGGAAMNLYKPAPIFALALLVAAGLGALFPDMDEEREARQLYHGLLAATGLVLLTNKQLPWVSVLAFAAMLPGVGDIGGWTHRWWAVVLAPLPVLVLAYGFFRFPLEILGPLYAAAALGIFSHLVLDFRPKSGQAPPEAA